MSFWDYYIISQLFQSHHATPTPAALAPAPQATVVPFKDPLDDRRTDPGVGALNSLNLLFVGFILVGLAVIAAVIYNSVSHRRV